MLVNMKKAVVSQFTDLENPLEIKSEEIPQPQGTEILVKLKACGCCHTDIHAIQGDWPSQAKLPLTPGHEGIGIIEAIGCDVSRFKVGDRIGIPWLYSTCGHCEYCQTGWETLCKAQENTGFSVNGCYAEYVLAHDSHVVAIPDCLTSEQVAPILCAGVTTYKGIKETEAIPGQFIAIMGAAGGLGHLAIQYAKAMGLRVIALDVGEKKRQFCLSVGAEHAIDISNASDTVVEQVLDYTGGGAHAVLCVATNHIAFQNSFKMCRPKGTMVCIGLPPGNFDIPIFDLVMHRITIRGSIVGTRQDLSEALDFAARGLVNCSVSTATLSEVNDVLKRIKEGTVEGRVVLQLDP